MIAAELGHPERCGKQAESQTSKCRLLPFRTPWEPEMLAGPALEDWNSDAMRN